MTARELPEEDVARVGISPRTLDEDHIVVQLSTGQRALPLLDGSSGLHAATPLALSAKRALDVVGSLLLLVALAPLFLVLAIGVKFSSTGPVLYWSPRVGKDGAALLLPKFRSMYVDAEERLQTLIPLNEAAGPVFKMREDPRVTPLGRFLRKASLDELPQLFTVLKGDMSLVGPRPPLEAEVAAYSPLERQRLSVKPGLTCIWQVSGRSDIDFDTWVEMDLDYIRHWTPSMDLRILLWTIPAVVTGRGAY